MELDEKQISFSDHYPKRKPQMHSEDKEAYGLMFWLTVAVSQVFGAACVVLIIIWCNEAGGFGIDDNSLLFNYHPLFMIFGLVVCYGDAIIVYRVLSFLPKLVLKIIHACLHISAIVFSSLALAAVFQYHKRAHYPDMYSLHSWIGIVVFGLFCLQYVGSFVTYLYPGLPANWRSRIMPFHVFLGVGIFTTAVGAAEMGILEKLMFNKAYSSLPKGAIIGNVLGLLILVFAFLIVHIATKPSYKRKPRPNEISGTVVN